MTLSIQLEVRELDKKKEVKLEFYSYSKMDVILFRQILYETVL